MRRIGLLILGLALVATTGCEVEVTGCAVDEYMGWDGLCYPIANCPGDICTAVDGYDYCVDPDMYSDPYNCGECGYACAADEACVDGLCVLAWVDECGGACSADEVCWGGACYAPYSSACCDEYCQYALCAYSDGSWGCADIDYDQFNCGGCGVYCDGVCSMGVCQAAGYTCADVGLDDCVTYCADLYQDESNCGSCGNWCAYDEFCAEGQCYPTTATCEDYGYTTCPDGCVDLNNDPYNCGACDFECVLGCDGAGECL